MELDSVQQRVVVDGTGMRGSVAQGFEVSFTRSEHIEFIDRGERYELHRIYFDLSALHSITATDPHSGSAPEPEGDRDVTGQHVCS